MPPAPTFLLVGWPPSSRPPLLAKTWTKKAAHSRLRRSFAVQPQTLPQPPRDSHMPPQPIRSLPPVVRSSLARRTPKACSHAPTAPPPKPSSATATAPHPFKFDLRAIQARAVAQIAVSPSASAGTNGTTRNVSRHDSPRTERLVPVAVSQ